MSNIDDDTCHQELKDWDDEVAHFLCPCVLLSGCHVSGEGDVIG